MSNNNHPSKLNEAYWNSFQLNDEDVDFLYNHLLELETPLTSAELTKAVITERIAREQLKQEKEKISSAEVYLPKESFQAGQMLAFPALDFQKGRVISTRPGINPAMPAFDVIEVEMDSGEIQCFACNLEDHELNSSEAITTDNPFYDPDIVLQQFGSVLLNRISESLGEKEGLVQIAGRWFPKALLVDINIGYLNMAEALLEMEEGGPLSTQSILKQIELPTDVNLKLTEFSLNFVLQEDERFDEVGPAGETLWFLKRLEPEMVREIPIFLKHEKMEYDPDTVRDLLGMLEADVIDELQPESTLYSEDDEVAVSLIFPHWQSGTLPLSNQIHSLFPTAYEAPRVRFTFADAENNSLFPGWVVRPSKYVYGLKDWYAENDLIPGSTIFIRRGKEPGKVIVRCEAKRTNREWIRTALVGSDGGVVFAMLKQIVPPGFNDRMAIFIPETDAIKELWEKKVYQKKPLQSTVMSMLQELSKLNPQGHVHALELYAAVNIVRRCSPAVIIEMLSNVSWAKHLGDLYFVLNKSDQSGGSNG